MYVLTDRDWMGAPQFFLALLLCGAAAVLLFASFGGGSHDPAAGPTAKRASAPAPPAIAIRREPVGKRFEVAGASFLVARRPAGAWGGAVGRLTARRGERLMAVAVEIVNRARSSFNPALLTYLLRGSGGAILAPLRAGVVGPDGLGRAGGLPVGARAEERLVFAVAKETRRPVLAIQPSLGRALEVRIPLGG